MSKPIDVGCASLESSNLTMLEFHYNVIENMFNIYILYLMVILIALYTILSIQIFMNGWKKTANILIYQIIHEKICEMMINNKKLRCFKDELNGRGMSEMLGSSPTSYAFKYQHIDKNHKRSIQSSCG